MQRSFSDIGSNLAEVNSSETENEQKFLRIAQGMYFQNAPYSIIAVMSNYNKEKRNDSRAKYRFAVAAYLEVMAYLDISKEDAVLNYKAIMILSITKVFLLAASEYLKELLKQDTVATPIIEETVLKKESETKKRTSSISLKGVLVGAKDVLTKGHVFDVLGGFIPHLLKNLNFILASESEQISLDINSSNVIKYLSSACKAIDALIKSEENLVNKFDEIKIEFMQKAFAHLMSKGSESQPTIAKIEELERLCKNLFDFDFSENKMFESICRLLEHCNVCVVKSRAKGTGLRAQNLEVLAQDLRDKLVRYLIAEEKNNLPFGTKNWEKIFDRITIDMNVSVMAYALRIRCIDAAVIYVPSPNETVPVDNATVLTSEQKSKFVFYTLKLLEATFSFEQKANLRETSLAEHIEKYAAQISWSIRYLLSLENKLTPTEGLQVKAFAQIFNYCLFVIEKGSDKKYQADNFLESTKKDYFIDVASYISEQVDIIEFTNKKAVEKGLIEKKATVFIEPITDISVALYPPPKTGFNENAKSIEEVIERRQSIRVLVKSFDLICNEIALVNPFGETYELINVLACAKQFYIKQRNEYSYTEKTQYEIYQKNIFENEKHKTILSEYVKNHPSISGMMNSLELTLWEDWCGFCDKLVTASSHFLPSIYEEPNFISINYTRQLFPSSQKSSNHWNMHSFDNVIPMSGPKDLPSLVKAFYGLLELPKDKRPNRWLALGNHPSGKTDFIKYPKDMLELQQQLESDSDFMKVDTGSNTGSKEMQGDHYFCEKENMSIMMVNSLDAFNDYKPSANKPEIVFFITTGPCVTYHIKDMQTGEELHMDMFNLQMMDNASLNFKTETDKLRFDLVVKNQHDSGVKWMSHVNDIMVIHCASGVGRTGTTLVAKKSYEFCEALSTNKIDLTVFSQQPKLIQEKFLKVARLLKIIGINKENVDSRIKEAQEFLAVAAKSHDAFAALATQKPLSSDQRSTIVTLFSTILAYLRSIRYCMQTEVQMKSALKLWVLYYAEKVLHFNSRALKNLDSAFPVESDSYVEFGSDFPIKEAKVLVLDSSLKGITTRPRQFYEGNYSRLPRPKELLNKETKEPLPEDEEVEEFDL